MDFLSSGAKCISEKDMLLKKCDEATGVAQSYDKEDEALEGARGATEDEDETIVGARGATEEEGEALAEVLLSDAPNVDVEDSLSLFLLTGPSADTEGGRAFSFSLCSSDRDKQYSTCPDMLI
mmetsp:Transcript_13973/g.20911  ORF Transcript_13973/g.20911 Transcript_13973/m.20911 type:complete len:123 (-) Transcript_13973:69-437(-)